MYLDKAKILENTEIERNRYLLKLEVNKSAALSKAGQFFMLKPKNEAIILRRPISLHASDKDKKILEFYYEIKGKGTLEFSKLKSEEIIDIQGPLGNGFNTDISDKTIVIIGGGMGIAPMKQLIEELKEKNRVIFIAGGRDIKALKILENINLNNVELFITTDDGSLGKKGNVVSELNDILKREKIDEIKCCGPQKMMQAVSSIAHKQKINCEISLEERMACGVKACVGCSIKTLEGMKKVCYDGPVFNSEIIVDVAPTENINCCKN